MAPNSSPDKARSRSRKPARRELAYDCKIQQAPGIRPQEGKNERCETWGRRSARPTEAAVSTHAPDSAERQFVEATIVRGQAVEARQPIPPGATHEIVKRDEHGKPILKRKRFPTC
jgi:hypothetical protein